MIRKFQHYYRVFQEVAELQGTGTAIRRAVAFVKTRVQRRLSPQSLLGKTQALVAPPPDPPALQQIKAVIATLPNASVSRNFVVIISDTQIRQCILYRIHQKIRYLAKIGITAQHIAPDQSGRLCSLLPFCHSIIIYRTALSAERIAEIRALRPDIKIIFEIDDLVIGSAPLQDSGILREIPETMGQSLQTLADEFLVTATHCDELIVSTEHLHRVYSKPKAGLADMPIHVIPNFLEEDSAARPQGRSDYTFAYTTPSGSIRTELQMLSAFLKAHDAVSEKPWTLVTMGNRLAAAELGKIPFKQGRIVPIPFADYDEYIGQISRSECVLIPLARTGFNSAKTPIRIMDAALAGTQAIFSPVGDYGQLDEAMGHNLMAVEDEDWGGAGTYTQTTLQMRSHNVRQLRSAVDQLFGPAAACETYRQVFVEDIGIPAGAQQLKAAE